MFMFMFMYKGSACTRLVLPNSRGSPCPALVLVLVVSFCVLCIAAPLSGTPGDESCMRDAKSRVRDEKELVCLLWYSQSRSPPNDRVCRRSIGPSRTGDMYSRGMGASFNL